MGGADIGVGHRGDDGFHRLPKPDYHQPTNPDDHQHQGHRQPTAQRALLAWQSHRRRTVTGALRTAARPALSTYSQTRYVPGCSSATRLTRARPRALVVAAFHWTPRLSLVRTSKKRLASGSGRSTPLAVDSTRTPMVMARLVVSIAASSVGPSVAG